ncbi:hypothetical protein GCM10025738_28040 [Microbacterium fluvii]
MLTTDSTRAVRLPEARDCAAGSRRSSADSKNVTWPLLRAPVSGRGRSPGYLDIETLPLANRETDE